MTDKENQTARIVGVLFLFAMATSLIGAVLIESVLDAPDYLHTVSADKSQLTIGVLLELIDAIVVIGVTLILIWNLLELVGVSLSFGLVFGLVIILNELFLGIWLILKGFRSLESGSDSTLAALDKA